VGPGLLQRLFIGSELAWLCLAALRVLQGTR
jgi:hypothetical protein